MDTNVAPTTSAPTSTPASPAAPSSSGVPSKAAPTGGGEASEPDEPGSPGSTQAQKPGSPGSTQAQKPAPTPSKPELFDVKVDGKIIKMTREELIQQASMGRASDQRFKEAAQLRKQAESVIGRLRDPKQVIAALQDPALGLTKEAIRETFEEWYAQEFIEPENLSPAEKKLREAEARLKKYEEQEKKMAEEKQRAQQEAMTSQAREELQKQIIEALDTSGLPKTNFTIRRLAYWMQRNQANGFDAPIEVVVGQVRNEINSSLRDLVEASDGEVLIKLLGDNLIQKVRKYDLEQLRKMRQPQGGGAPTPSSDPAPTEDKHGRPLTSAEVTERIRNLQRTGRY